MLIEILLAVLAFLLGLIAFSLLLLNYQLKEVSK